MKERPILFSGPMVRAILEGRKTMTRRVCKPLSLGWVEYAESEGKLMFDGNPWVWVIEFKRVEAKS